MAVAGAAPAEAQDPQFARAAYARGMATGLTLLQTSRDQSLRLAAKTPRGIVDIGDAAKLLGMPAPETMDDLLQNEDGPRLNALVSAVLKMPRAAQLFKPESNLEYGPVVARPGKILCVGLNYRAHAQELGDTLPKQPILFNKYNNTLNNHRGFLKLPSEVATKFDYEVELVAAIGNRAKNVSEAEALSYVAGYFIGNDFTARDLQYDSGGQWMIGKTLDQFAPVGPYFVTADQIDPSDLALECRVNGETRQSSRTSRMIFDCRKLVSYISRHIVLEPGDIIFTGTPEGVIYGMPPEKRKWLVAGDTIACSVQGLGELTFGLT